jgi:Ser/Thr protein kinase RdoA (MazF antagonist)
VAAAAALYNLPDTSLASLRGGHVSQVYAFRLAGREYVLRLTPPNDEIDAASQLPVLAWMQFLAQRGARVPEPLSTRNGKLVETVAGWTVSAQTRAKGVLSEEYPLSKWDAPLFEALGQAAGKLHAVARLYQPAADLRRPDWDAAGNLFKSPAFDRDWLAEKAAAVRARTPGLSRSADGFGLIHADLHFGNFYVDTATRAITVFDFDDCCYGWYTMDLAILLFDVLVLYEGQDREAFGRDFMSSLLRGYRVETGLVADWAEQVQLFMKLLEINIYGDLRAGYQPGKDWWADKFMPGREERIREDRPFFEPDLSVLV